MGVSGMRFRSHLLAAAAVGLALYPRAPWRAALTILSGVALDTDHFLLYALRSGDWNPVGALRYDRWRHHPPRRGDTRPRYGSLRSVAHEPQITLPLVWLAALLWSPLRPVAVGLTVHLALDLHLPHYDWRIRLGRVAGASGAVSLACRSKFTRSSIRDTAADAGRRTTMLSGAPYAPVRCAKRGCPRTCQVCLHRNAGRLRKRPPLGRTYGTAARSDLS